MMIALETRRRNVLHRKTVVRFWPQQQQSQKLGEFLVQPPKLVITNPSTHRARRPDSLASADACINYEVTSRRRNDLYRVGWGVKLYSPNHLSPTQHVRLPSSPPPGLLPLLVRPHGKVFRTLFAIWTPPKLLSGAC